MTIHSTKETEMTATAETATLAFRCPKCHGEMLVYERQGIVVDQCRDCRGVWLDRGELDHLIDLEARMARDSGRLEGATRGLSAAPWGRPAEHDVRGRDDDRGRDDRRRAERYDRDDRSWDDDDDDRRSDGQRHERRRGGLFGELFEGILE